MRSERVAPIMEAEVSDPSLLNRRMKALFDVFIRLTFSRRGSSLCRAAFFWLMGLLHAGFIPLKARVLVQHGLAGIGNPRWHRISDDSQSQDLELRINLD